MADMFAFKGLELNPSLLTKTNRAVQEAQRFIDSECLRLSQPKVPRDIAAASQGGTLEQSGIIHSAGGQIKWETPYSRRWYYMPAKFQGALERGNYWFERMKQQHREAILKGAQKVLKENL